MMIYTPAEDSFLLQSVISKYVKGKNVLDMGTGSGILAETSQKSKAKSVLAVDINEKAVDYVKSKKIPSIKSDLFSKIPEDKKFDVIIFNPPYLPKDNLEDQESELITSGGQKGDEIIVRFLEESSKHLENDGSILLLTSTLTPLERINKVLESKHMEKRQIAEKKIFFEKLIVWLIKRAQ